MSVGIGTLLGMSFLLAMNTFGILKIPSAGLTLGFAQAFNSFLFFSSQTYTYLKDFSMVSIIILMSVFSYFLNIVSLIQKRKNPVFLELYIFIFTSVVIISPILSGKITGLDSIRYNYHAMIVLVVFFPYFFDSVLLKSKNKLNQNLKIILLIVIALSIVTKFSSKKLMEKINFYPLETKRIDKLKEELD